MTFFCDDLQQATGKFLSEKLSQAYWKIRVFLSVQFCSQTMIKMIKDYCHNANNFGDISEFQPMIDLFDVVDRLVDIMNGTGFKNGRDRDVELINHPHHCHTIELFGILRIFERG